MNLIPKKGANKTMSIAVEAIFEDGVLKPVIPLEIPEHMRLHLIIEAEAEEPSGILSLASEVYSGFSPSDIKDLESVALDRSRFSRD